MPKESPEDVLRKLINDPATPPSSKVELSIVLAGLTKESRSRRHDRAMQRIKQEIIDKRREPAPSSTPRPPLGQVAQKAVDDFMEASRKSIKEVPEAN